MIKKNTQTRIGFVMIDSSDHVTPKTGLTVLAQISKDGAAFSNSVNSVSEVGSGFYSLVLTASEMNADLVMVKLTATGADQQNLVFYTEADYSATRAAKLDNLTKTLDNLEQAIRGANNRDITQIYEFVDKIDDATDGLTNIRSLVDDLETRLTATRANYLDNLSGGPVALQETLNGVKSQTDKMQFTSANDIKATLDGEEVILANNSVTAEKIATDAIGADELSTAAVQKIAAAILEDPTYKLNALDLTSLAVGHAGKGTITALAQIPDTVGLIEAWFRLPKGSAGGGFNLFLYLNKDATDLPLYGYQCSVLNNGTLKFYRWDGDTHTTLISANWTPNTAWHRLRVTRDANALFKIFLDDMNTPIGQVTDATYSGANRYVGIYAQDHCQFRSFLVFNIGLSQGFIPEDLIWRFRGQDGWFPANWLDGRERAIKAKTDNLPDEAVAKESTAQAIKAKTDNLPSEPASKADVTVYVGE